MSTTVTVENKVNGVDVNRLADTVEAVRGNPSLARFQFRAGNRWLRGAHNQSRIQGFYGAGAEDASRTSPFVFDADEPGVLLGDDRAANPVEYLLHALAACMTTSMVYHAAARGITIESVESRFEGDLDLHGFLGLDPDVRPGYQDIRASFKIQSAASAEDLKELFKFSPVHNSVSEGVNIETTVEKINA